MARKLILEVILDTVAYARQIQKAQLQTAQLGKGLEKTGTTGSTALLGLGKSAGIATAAFLGAQGLAAAARASFGEMANAQKVSAQTAAVLESTGGAAGVTAKQVDDLAASLMHLSGVDDEAIKSAENLLLTFTKIHKDTFPAATKAALDMSVALDEDLQTAALQVGKALQDPIRGITALRRAGVEFSSDQVKLIARLVETGHTVQAQKIILEELNTEFGKSAEAAGKTLPGQLSILQQNMLNLGGAIAAKTTPALTGFVGALNQMFENIRNNSNTLDDFLRKIHVLESGKLPFRRAPTGGGPGPTGPVGGSAAGSNFVAGPTGPLLPQLTAADIARLNQQRQLRNQWFDAMIGRLQLQAGVTTNLDKQIQIYRTIAAKLQARIDVTNDITGLQHLEDQALQVNAQIAAAVAQKRQQALDNLIGGADIPLLQAQVTKGLTDNLAALELQRQLILKAIRIYGNTKDLQMKLIQNQIDVQGIRDQQQQAAQAAAEQARQERVGWMEFAFERAQATKSVADDLKTANVLLKYWQRQAATGKRTLEEAQQVFRWQQEIANLRKKGNELQTKFTPVDPNKFVQSLGLTGLTPAQARTIGAAAAGIGRGGTLPAGGRTPAFALAGAGVVVHGDLNLHGVQDVPGLANALTKYGKTRPSPRRGAR